MLKFAWIAIFLVVLIWSGIEPKDYPTWALEVFPAVAGAAILAFTYKTFRLTPMNYVLILVYCVVLMIGGHYTYAEVPFFEALQPVFGWERNNYDKLGHLLQGFVPAIIAREVLIRNHVVDSDTWRNFFIICICLAISAFYELIEWTVALLSEQAAESFLGTQGYIWDTQADMAFALVGVISALMLLSKPHDRQLKQLRELGL